MEVNMDKRTFHKPILALLVTLLMVLGAIQPAIADDSDNEIEFKGMVVAISEDALSFQVQTEMGELYTVIPDEGFDLLTLRVGSIVEVDGILNEDGTVAVKRIHLERPDDDQEPPDEGGDLSDSYYCRQSEVQHPFGARLVERYAVDYATLQAWFCNGYGWGQIMLALQTGQMVGGDPGTLLEARREGKGWGLIWQELNLIGRPEDGGPPNDLDGDGKPDHAGPKKEHNPPGRPDTPGKSESHP
jgi:hypothetical protein